MGPETQVLRQASAAEPKGYPACGNYITQTPFGQWVQRIKTESESGPLNWDACFDNNCTVYACIHKPQPQLNTVNKDIVYRNIMRWQNLTQFVISHSYLIRDVFIATNWFCSLKLVSLSTSTVPDTHAQQRGRNLSAVHVVFLFCFFLHQKQYVRYNWHSWNKVPANESILSMELVLVGGEQRTRHQTAVNLLHREPLKAERQQLRRWFVFSAT